MANILTQEEIDTLLQKDNKSDTEQKQKYEDHYKDIFTYLGMELVTEYRYKNNIIDKIEKDEKICNSITYIQTIKDMIEDGIKNRKFNIEHYIGYVADEIARLGIILKTLNKFGDNNLIFDEDLLKDLDIVIDKILEIKLKQKCCKSGECTKEKCCSKRPSTKYTKKQ